jgi:alanine-synthesizing transaminase
MRTFEKSHKLDQVCYDIRGPVLNAANALESSGKRILKLNIGNLAAFGFDAPEELIQDIIKNLSKAQGYCDSKGLFPARKAVVQYYQKKDIRTANVEDIYLGNGVSELVMISMQALLNNGDEILIPAPDFPLWTAAVSLSGGSPVHYICDEQSEWLPDLEDIERKITTKTKGIVVINPNNPTGALYPDEILEKIVALAKTHNLIVYADEIYDKIVYDGHQHRSIASISDEILTITYNGLSKNYRAAGFRSGWMLVSGAKNQAKDYIDGLNLLSTLRLCANVPSQLAIQTALGGYQSIDDLILPDGRLGQQREIAWKIFSSIDGVSCVKPKGALYLFPKLDTKKIPIKDDEKFVLDLLVATNILVVHGAAFNLPTRDHFRIVFLPYPRDLTKACKKIGDFLANYRQ